MVALLRASRIDVSVRLQKALDGLPRTQWGIRHDKALKRALGDMLTDLYGAIYQSMEKDLKAYTGIETQYQIEMFKGLLPAQIQAFNPIASISKTQVFAASIEQPFQGSTLAQWAGNQSDSLLRGIMQQARMGYIQGETTTQIAKRVNDGAFNTAELNLSSVTKSAVSHFAAAAREEMGRANADLIKSREWLSTLDTHTSKMCIIRDGKMYTMEEKPKPIGHSIPYGDGPGKLHFCCRSTETWVIKSYRELGIDADELPPGTRASMNGQIPSDMKYAQWLARQPKSVIEDVVGVYRAQAIEAGKLKPSDLYSDRGEWLTLEQLAKKKPEAFEGD